MKMLNALLAASVSLLGVGGHNTAIPVANRSPGPARPSPTYRRAHGPTPAQVRARKRLAKQRQMWADTPVKPVEGTRAHKRRNARTVAKRLGVPLANVWRSIQTGEAVEGI